MLWAMPRRIRLVVEKADEVCKVSGLNSSYTVKDYLTKNYGNNYSGTWAHPLTPYKWDPKKPNEEHLSIKGQPGGINYKSWDVLTISSDAQGQACAKVVEQYHSLARELNQGEVPRLWAFGYDLDNMKPRGWYSVTLPIFPLEEERDDILFEIKQLQSISNNALWHTRTQIKSAWFERPGEVKGDTSFIDLAFWQRSESIFFDAVASLIDNAQTAEAMLTPEQADYWLKRLRAVCMDLFDEYALSDLGGQRSMAKRIKARQALTGWLFGGKEIKRFIDDYQVANLKDMA
jgi:CRISPR system Cascade subunit CasA